MAFRMFNFSDNDQNTTPVTALARRLNRAFAPIFDNIVGTQPVSTIKAKDVATDMSLDSNQLNIVPRQWKVAQDRMAMYIDIEAMDRGDGIIPTALDITADCAVDFLRDAPDSRIRFRSDDVDVQRVLDDLVRRLDLDNTIWQIAREMAMHGSIFREVVMDMSGSTPCVGLFKQTIPYEIWPKTNERGDKLPGWVVKRENDVFSGGGLELAEWQVIPFLFGAKKGYLSVPPLASIRSDFQKLAKVEDGMIVARLIRAYDKYVHKVPVGKEWEGGQILSTIRAYKQNMTKRQVETTDGQINQLDNPLDVQTDFYVPDDGTNRGGVEVLNNTNINLGNLNDVLYAHEKLLVRLKVPVDYYQLSSHQKSHVSAKAGKTAVQVQWARYLRSLQSVLKRGISRLADMELLLQLPPDKFARAKSLYTIELYNIDIDDSTAEAELMLTQGQAAVYFLEAFGALPPELIAEKFMELTPKQRIIMEKFLATEGQQIIDARVKALENNAIVPAKVTTGIGEAPGKPGSGNNNKSTAKRSTEQKGQSISIDDLTDVFCALQQSVNEELRNDGIEISENINRNFIKNNLANIAYCGDFLIE